MSKLTQVQVPGQRRTAPFNSRVSARGCGPANGMTSKKTLQSITSAVLTLVIVLQDWGSSSLGGDNDPDLSAATFVFCYVDPIRGNIIISRHLTRYNALFAYL